MSRTVSSQRAAWRHIPVDDAGYFDTAGLLRLSDPVLLQVARDMEYRRYHGWRNHKNLWREHMGLDVNHGRVLDYGCGMGIEAVQYARSGNLVCIADQNKTTVQLAERVLRLYGYPPELAYTIDPRGPEYIAEIGDCEFDLVVMNGVLHHILPRHQAAVVSKIHDWLADGGELRVMVYTDVGWRLATGTEPPGDVTRHPKRLQFVRWGDEVGDWADWFDQDRLTQKFGEWFTVREFHYIANDGRYGIAIMDKR